VIQKQKRPSRALLLSILFTNKTSGSKRLADVLHCDVQTDFFHRSHSLARFLEAQCLAACSTEPKVLHAMNWLVAAALRIKNENAALTQIMEWFRAHWIRALVYHWITPIRRSVSRLGK
jgi:hypothetical protein